MSPQYKHGKQTSPIEFKVFDKAMREGYFTQRSHRSFSAFLYWFGVRRSEVLERVKEDFEVKDNVLIVDCPAKKGGYRELLEISVDLPYVNLIIEQVHRTLPRQRVWKFSHTTAWKIVKRSMGEKFYPHFFRLNRATRFLEDPTTTIPEMKAWFGWKSTGTIDTYIGVSRRHIRKQADRLKQEVKEIG